ncbi:MAG TPA: YbaK/EbsC family protein [Thermoanaerobaculia bacterium]
MNETHAALPQGPAPDPAWDRVRRALDALRIPYEAMPCDPDFADTAAFYERYGIPARESANTILVASRQEPRKWAACLVLSHCRLDVNHAVSRLLGVKRLSFASADETREKTGMMIGGVSLFGLPDDVPVFVDARVLEAPRVVVGGGSRSWKVRLDPRDLAMIPGARTVEGLATVKVPGP